MEHAFDNVEKELENNLCVSVRARLSDLDNFSVNPFVRNKIKLTDEQKKARAERLKTNSR